MGRFCIVCERTRPNEAFGGKGQRARICRKCRRMPRDKRNARLHEREIRGFLEQSRISERNGTRLRALARSADAQIAKLAAVVLEVAQVAPNRRLRIRTLAREHRDVLKRMEDEGLILPWIVCDDIDPNDVDPIAAWYEWVEFAEDCTAGRATIP